MLWQWWLGLALVIPCVAAWVWTAIDGDVLDNVLPGYVAVGLSIFAAIFLISGFAISVGRHYGRVSCRTFAAQTHRTTKFVIYTSWDGGDCLTQDGSGHWIPTKNLREFGSKP